MKNIIPLNVISYLIESHKYYKEEMIDPKDWETADEIHRILLRSYHVYLGIKKDYRKIKK